jgi:hypothetical protein
MLDYEQIVKSPDDRIGRHMTKEGWTSEDIQEMICLLKKDLE